MSRICTYETVDQVLARQRQNEGEPPISTLSRAFVDAWGNASLHTREDGAVIATKTGQVLVNPDGTLNVAGLNDPRLVQAAYSSRDYAGENYQALASFVAGTNPNESTVNLFKLPVDNANGASYAWDPSSWAGSLDLTCFSPWNSRGNNQQGGCLITPRHVVLADHFSNPAHGTVPMVPGATTIKFVSKELLPDGTNKVYTRTITALNQCGTSDVLIGTLDSDLPAAIKPAKLLPFDRGSFIGKNLPALVTNQFKQAHIAAATVDPAYGPDATVLPAQDGVFAPWTINPLVVDGDSGSPIFFVLNGEVCLDSVFHTPTGGSSVSAQIAAINALVGTQYALTVPAFTTTRDAKAYRPGDDAYFSSVGADKYSVPPGTILADDAGDPQPLQIWTSNAAGQFQQIAFAPGQSLRVKADSSGWEAYDPGVPPSVDPHKTGAIWWNGAAFVRSNG